MNINKAGPLAQKDRTQRKLFLFLLLTFSLFLSQTFLVFARVRLEKAEYEGNGRVCVEFTQDIHCRNLKVTVKDAQKNTLKATIVEIDEDEITFYIDPSSLVAGATYSFTLKGIASLGETTYSSLTGSFTLPKSSQGFTLKEIDIDNKDKEITFEFKERLQYHKPSVSITRSGKEYVKKIKELDSHEIEIKLKKKLKKGKTYQYQIAGIRKKGDSAYTTITGEFVAR